MPPNKARARHYWHCTRCGKRKLMLGFDTHYRICADCRVDRPSKRKFLQELNLHYNMVPPSLLREIEKSLEKIARSFV